jgi:exopolyphosphatase/guanosine-5'-triphosphate,3'-diphosphate pyrophosphatase
VKNLFNVDAQIIGGDEEAQLTFRGALSGLSTSDADGRVAVFDVGGGSTEVVIGCLTERGPEIDFAESYDVGSVRLTERIVRSDPPSHAEIQEMSEYVRRVFERIPPLPVRTSIPIGIAGTVTTLMAVSMSLAEYDGSVVHGRLMSRDSLRHVVSDLASVDLNARRRRAGLAPGRADVIVAGGLVVLELLAHWGASEMRVSDRGVRWGLAEGLAK